ncbi:MAG: hypothetical protein AAF317_10630 [Pseudomonadota bacterium]
MQRRFSDWVDDPRIVTIAVTTLIAAALWVATWSVMGRMDMSTMGMSGMEMGTMPADGSTMTMPMNDADGAMNGTGGMGSDGTMQGTDGIECSIGTRPKGCSVRRASCVSSSKGSISSEV